MVLFVFFELCLMAFEEFFGTVFAAQLEDVVAPPLQPIRQGCGPRRQAG